MPKYTINEVKLIAEKYNLTLLSEEYKDASSPLLFKCNNCGVTFFRPLLTIIKGSYLCPECKSNINE